jgi:hypothetical protein
MALGEFQCKLWTKYPISAVLHENSKGDAPICRSNGKLLIDKLASFFENEMTPLSFATFACAKCSNQSPLGVRDEGIRQFFLYARVIKMISVRTLTKEARIYLCLPFGLGCRRIGAQAVHIKV